MKIIILGAKGFIGSNALRYFRLIHEETYGCDVTPPEDNDPRYFILDRNEPQFDKLFLQNSFDVCINASGSGSVPYSMEHPAEDYRLNAKNVFDILSAISRFNTRCRFLNFSSAAVYGNPESLPLSEKSRTKPLSPYGFHKLISEQICAEFYHLKKIQTCSMRVFSAYGEGLRKQIFWDIYQKSLKSNQIELFGTGEETRDFIHINDLLLALERILEKSSFEADIINVASGTSSKIRECACFLAKAIDPDLRIVFNGSSKPGDPVHLEADITKLTSFGFNTKYSLEEGLTAYSQWVK